MNRTANVAGKASANVSAVLGAPFFRASTRAGAPVIKNKRRQSHPRNVVQSFRGLIGFRQEGRKYDENPRYEIEEGYYDSGKSKGHTTNFTE
jgi:hypothetical protein